MIGSVYCDITLQTVPDSLETAVKEFKLSPILVGMDSNAHNSIWGSSNDNSRGLELEDFLVEHQLEPFNMGNLPTYDCRTGTSVIDLTIGNSEMSSFVQGWRVLSADLSSDHKALEILVRGSPRLIEGRDWSKMDWDRFKFICSDQAKKHDWPEVWNNDILEGYTALFEDVVNGALDETAPKVRRKLRTELDWFTNELKDLQLHTQAALNRARKCNVEQKPELYRKYRESRLKYVREIKKHKRKYWQDFCSSSNTVKSTAKLVNIITNKTSSRINLLKGPGGNMTRTPEETLDVLLAPRLLATEVIGGEKAGLSGFFFVC